MLKRVMLGCVTATIMLVTAAGAQAACSSTWVGGSGVDWMTAGDWSPSGVPAANANVCIPSGSPVLEQGGANSPALASLTISGSGGLTVDIHQVLVSAATSIGPNASLTLDGSYHGANAGNASLGGGTVLNQGTITMEGAGYQATLYGTVTNQGTIDVPAGSGSLGQGDNGGTGSLLNEGTIAIAAPSAANTNNEPALTAIGFPITNAGGTIANGGTFDVVGANGTTGSFDEGAGTETGNPISLGRGTSLAWTGSGASSFDVGPCDAAVPMSGNLSAGQNLTVAIGTGVEESGSFSSAGNVVLDDTYLGSGCGETSILTDSGTFTNTGTIMVQGGGTPFLTGAVVNQGTVTVVPGTTLQQQTGSFTNGASGTLVPEISSSAIGGFQSSGTGLAAGGTLHPLLEGGFIPTDGQAFKVITGNDVTGTFASVAGGFGADYSQAGQVSVVYGKASTPPPVVQPRARAGSVSGGRGTVKVQLSCPSGGAVCPRITVRVQLTEYLRGKRIVAVATSTKPRKKLTRKVVTIAGAALSRLAAGHTTTVTLKLDRSGLTLLRRYHPLHVVATISESGKTIRSAVVRVQPAPSRTRQKK